MRLLTLCGPWVMVAAVGLLYPQSIGTDRSRTFHCSVTFQADIR